MTGNKYGHSFLLRRTLPLYRLVVCGFVAILSIYLYFFYTIVGFKTRVGEVSSVNRNVHAFYYPWYCNVEIDGKYMHWNHQRLPHWNKAIAKQWPSGEDSNHDPTKDDLGSTFFPQLGAYSSADPAVMKQHMIWLRQAGIGVAVVSWLPLSAHDDNGPPIANRLGPLLDVALEHDIRIAVHMEPYHQESKTAESVYQEMKELLDAYGNHPALFRMERDGKMLPLLYFYDQYLADDTVWKEVFQPQERADALPTKGRSRIRLRGGRTDTTTDGTKMEKPKFSIRGTEYDVFALALIVEQNHWGKFVRHCNFDGGYTYFAANHFTWGSKPQHWKMLQEWAVQDSKLFVPSIGPGYDDTSIRPWNDQTTRKRNQGQYFDTEWQAAMDSGTATVSITSFNEWHEGTQIEPSIPKVSKDGRRYKDFSAEGGPYAYLNQNKKWVDEFSAQRN